MTGWIAGRMNRVDCIFRGLAEKGLLIFGVCRPGTLSAPLVLRSLL